MFIVPIKLNQAGRKKSVSIKSNISFLAPTGALEGAMSDLCPSINFMQYSFQTQTVTPASQELQGQLKW